MNVVSAANKHEIAVIHSNLSKKFPPLYADIWKIGCNLSLRISDLLSLEYSQIDYDKREIQLTEQKTGKAKHLRLNDSALSVIKKRQNEFPEDRYLFQVRSNRATNQPISRISVSRVFKQVGKMVGLDINTHSMRKSRGKAMFDDNVPVAVIAKVLNHSSEAATLRYLGITEEQVLQTYDDYEL